MFRNDIERICAETLLGRFGPSLISPRKKDDLVCASALTVADTAATFRNAAVWTTARSGFEQGKL